MKTIFGFFLIINCLVCTVGAQDVRVEQAAVLVKQSKTFILDVRTAEEFDAGHFRGAVNVPVAALKEERAQLPADKNQPILTYCTVGVRSARARRILKAMGYQQVYNLAGGINAWINAGQIVTEPARIKR